MSWLGFWIFLSVLVICDSWIFSTGCNSLLQHYETPEEKELQREIIAERIKK